MINRLLKNGWLWFFVLSAAVIYYGKRNIFNSSSQLTVPGSGYMLASNKTVAKIPAEVINLQEAFSNVADLAKEAVVSISTVQIKSYEYYSPYEFFFGDPFEEFFGTPRRRQQPRQGERRYEGMGSGVVIDQFGACGFFQNKSG